MVNGIFISPRESEAGANHRGFPALPPELKSFWLYSPARLLQCKAARTKMQTFQKMSPMGEKK